MADVVVVGAGLSGLECANAIVGAGVADVLVVEAGGPPSEDGVAARPWWVSALPPHYPPPSGRPAAGGRSLRWHGVVLRLEEWALADPCWPEPVRSALCHGPQGAAGGLYAQTERDLAAWSGGPLAATPPDSARALARVLGSAADVPQAVRPDGPDGQRAYTPLDRWHGWLDRGSRPGLPRMRTGSRVLEVVTQAGRVTGVRVADVRTGSVEVIGAGTVVLAAGTLDNTRLVAQLEGKRPRSFPGLNDHLVQGFVARLPAAALGLARPVEAFGYAPGDPWSRSNTFARIRSVPGDPENLLLDVWAMGEQVRSDGNSVSFPGSGEVPWRGVVTPALAGPDQEVLAAQRRRLARLWADVAGRRGDALGLPDYLTAPFPFDRALARARSGPVGVPVGYSWPLGTVEHESGTLPLGGADVDDGGRLRCVHGGYVVGPATLPRSGAANPSLTTLALARWTAGRLVVG